MIYKTKLKRPNRIASEIELYLRNIGKNKGRERTRELVRIRDNHTCLDCGKKILTKDIIKHNLKIKTLKTKLKALDVHHINGQCGKNSTGYDSTKNLSGMITLCHKCHFNRPEHKCKSTKFRQNLITKYQNLTKTS